MRLARLDLTRYGKFTDLAIDFGALKDGQPDLHILYGANEAGKTTALSAYLDLLFGIETQGRERRSRYSFLHPEATLRIGAALEIDGTIRELARIKNPQRSLLDGADRPVTDAVLAGELGGLDRDTYRAMFSLDDDTIESGGESILASKGDLGQLLFSATAGLAELGRRLVDIRGEADKIYKKHARASELHDLKSRLASLKEERAKIDTIASQYAVLVHQRDTTKGLYDDAMVARGLIEARRGEIGRLLTALPRLNALNVLRGRLDALQELPNAPVNAAEDLPGLTKDDLELSIRVETASQDVARLTAEHDEIVLDDPALSAAVRFGSLEVMRARHMTAEEDLPGRRDLLREYEIAIRGILERLGRIEERDPKRLILKAGVVGRLRTLIEQRASILSSLESAEEEAEGAQRRLDAAIAKYEEAGGGVDTSGEQVARMAAFAATVLALSDNDLDVRRRTAERERQEASRALQDRLSELAPWTGAPEKLAALAVPDKTAVERWKSAISAARKKVDESERDIERLVGEQQHLQAEREAIERTTGVVTDQQAIEARAERDTIWGAHRRSLSEETADAFEHALRRDDGIGGARLSHANELARVCQIETSQARVMVDLDLARKMLSKARAALDEAHAEIVGVLGSLAPKTADEFAISSIEEWLRRREGALTAVAKAGSIERQILDIEQETEAASGRLRKAFIAVGTSFEPSASFGTLVQAAHAIIAANSKLTDLRYAVEDRRSDCADRERKRARATGAEKDWATSWSDACVSCWLGETGETPTVADVREILTIVGELGSVLEKQAVLVDRIEKMEENQASYASAIAEVARDLGVETGGKVLEIASAIAERVQAASKASDLKSTKLDELKQAQTKQRALTEKLALHEKRRTALLGNLGAASLEEAGAVLDQIKERAELQRQGQEASEEICEAMGNVSLTDAENALATADRAALEAERAELDAKYMDLDERSRSLFSDFNRALEKVDAVGGDDAVARIEEQRRTTLLEVEDNAQRYLRLRLGALAAEQALRIYRDKHRSSMMKRAGEAFQTISRGAYRGLVAQPDKDGEVLVAIGADGGSKIASELSKGTRFQLYLALRVAGYHEFVSARRPVPFIADDIMETFDDDRSEEAFRLFAGMAMEGQVIYLTHHKHLCDIATRVCPEAKIHRLP